MAAKMGFTQADLRKFCRLYRQRTELEREAEAISVKLNQIRDSVAEYLRSVRKSSDTQFGHLLQLIEGRGNVKWKDEFIRVLGEKKAAAIAKAAPKVRTIKITKV